jgi:predicted DNA-binding transcriptional regulator YafY
VPIRSRDWLVRLIASSGADALVLEPADLRAAVLARLRSVRAGDGADRIGELDVDAVANG